MNSSFPNRWSFSYLKFTKCFISRTAEPKYKYGQQEQVTVKNHNRNTALERSVLKLLGALTGFTGTQYHPRLLSWLKTYSCSVHKKVFYKYKFMIKIALPKELGGKGFVTTAEVTYVRSYSSSKHTVVRSA